MKTWKKVTLGTVALGSAACLQHAAIAVLAHRHHQKTFNGI